jgi:hypothetical protein
MFRDGLAGVCEERGSEEMIMARLDLAMLAEHARVDQAGLLVVDAGGFAHVRLAGPGGALPMAVVLRFWITENEPNVQFEIKMKPPGGEYELALNGTAAPGAVSRPVDGLIGVSVAVRVTLPLPVSGRYVVEVWTDDALVRELPFIVEFEQG